MFPEKLIELRKHWEKYLKPILEIKNDFDTGSDDDQLYTLLVVLKDKGNKYHAYRYFSMEGGKRWEISCDINNGTADNCFEWLQKRFNK